MSDERSQGEREAMIRKRLQDERDYMRTLNPVTHLLRASSGGANEAPWCNAKVAGASVATLDIPIVTCLSCLRLVRDDAHATAAAVDKRHAEIMAALAAELESARRPE